MYYHKPKEDSPSRSQDKDSTINTVLHYRITWGRAAEAALLLLPLAFTQDTVIDFLSFCGQRWFLLLGYSFKRKVPTPPTKSEQREAASVPQNLFFPKERHKPENGLFSVGEGCKMTPSAQSPGWCQQQSPFARTGWSLRTENGQRLTCSYCPTRDINVINILQDNMQRAFCPKVTYSPTAAVCKHHISHP